MNIQYIKYDNNISFNSDNDKLHIDDNTKQKNYPLLSTLNIPFTSHTMSVLLYEIIKLSQEFPTLCTMDIKHPEGSLSKVINISKYVKFYIFVLIVLFIICV